jgi:hypothetical protein
MSNEKIIQQKEVSFLRDQYNRINELIKRFSSIQPFDLSKEDFKYLHSLNKEREELSRKLYCE